ncbi:MAG: hypothetical protein ACI9K2_005888, partial [Myxococcota bacterium]
MLVCHTRLRLTGFAEADTSSTRVGHVEVGGYTVLEQHTEGDGDYVKLGAAVAGNDVWICSQWGATVYADVGEQAAPVRIAEAALIERLEAFAAFGYSTHDPRYPFELPGISTSSSPPENNNCCTFVEAL